MLDEQDRGRSLFSPGPESVEEGGCPMRIEIGRRFVEDDDLGPRDQHPGERKALLLATRQAVRPTALETRETRLGDRVTDANPHRIKRAVAILEAERDLILDSLHHQLRPRILEDEADVPGDLAPLGHARVDAGNGEVACDSPRELAWDQTGDGKTEGTLA
jgi:hypothetical protein